MKKSRYTLTYGQDAPYSRTAKLLFWIVGVIFSALLLQEFDAALGIVWSSAPPVLDRTVYDSTRMAFGAGAMLSFLWATRDTAVKITSH